MKKPPNLHLHSFQRISREWNVWRSLEDNLSFDFLAEAKEGLERAYGELAASSRYRRGSERDVEWQAIVVRANNEILPSRICSSASEISTGKTAPSCARNPFAAIVDRNKGHILSDVSQNIGKDASHVDAEDEKEISSGESKVITSIAFFFLSTNIMNIRKENMFLTNAKRFINYILIRIVCMNDEVCMRVLYNII